MLAGIQNILWAFTEALAIQNLSTIICDRIALRYFSILFIQISNVPSTLWGLKDPHAPYGSRSFEEKFLLSDIISTAITGAKTEIEIF